MNSLCERVLPVVFTEEQMGLFKQSTQREEMRHGCDLKIGMYLVIDAEFSEEEYSRGEKIFKDLGYAIKTIKSGPKGELRMYASGRIENDN